VEAMRAAANELDAMIAAWGANEVYRDFEAEARQRLRTRDPEDWLILAAALALGCPIWTADTDFFGWGIATWTSASIVVFLRQ
jgi:predicted nucleic acid-binding protein